MSTTGQGLVALVKEFGRIVFVDPIRDGRLEPRSWPSGWATIMWLSLIGYLAVGGLTVAAGPLRGHTPLASVDSFVLPSIALPVLNVIIAWCVTLLVTAALHAHWSLRVLGGAFAVAILLPYPLYGLVGSPLVAIVGILALVALLVLLFVRSGRRAHWGEFAVVASLVILVTQVPLIAGLRAISFGWDLRGSMVRSAILTSGILAMPAMIVAGAALAMVAITASESAAKVVAQSAGSGVRIGVIVALLGVCGYDAYRRLTDADSPLLDHLLPTLAYLAIAALIAVTVWFAGRRPSEPVPRPGLLAEGWAPWLYGLAAAFVWSALLTIPISSVNNYLSAFIFKQGGTFLDPLTRLDTFVPGGVRGLRVVTMVVALSLAVRLARRGRVWVPIILSAFVSAMVCDLVTSLTGLRLYLIRPPEAVSLVFVVAAAGVFVWRLLTKRLDARSARGITAVLALAALFPHRDFLDEPGNALLGFSGLAAILFGLIWRALTEGEYTRRSNKALPASSRVLLFAAVSTFAVLRLSWASLTRTSDTVTDMINQGDAMLGQPLFLGSLWVALWVALGRGQDAPETDESDPADTAGQAWPAPGVGAYPAPPASPPGAFGEDVRHYGWGHHGQQLLDDQRTVRVDRPW